MVGFNVVCRFVEVLFDLSQNGPVKGAEGSSSHLIRQSFHDGPRLPISMQVLVIPVGGG